MKKSILFILPVSSQPRFSKRIQTYLDQDISVTVASFERDYFEKNKLPDNINYYSLGKIKNKSYVKRIPRLLSSLKKLLSLSKGKEVVFIFSPDILILLYNFLSKEKLYFEIGDIRKASNNNFIAKSYDLVYGKALRKCKKIFVTSEDFKSFINKKYKIELNKINIIENKLPSKFFPLQNRIPFVHLENKRFTIGIIGLLRYQNIINFLKTSKNQYNKFDIRIFGDGPLKKEILDYVDGNRVQYFGQFKNPDDLPAIYEQIDLSFTMYDSRDKNVQMALPNKLYESIYFKRPILVSTNTFLEKNVRAFDIGFSWDQSKMVELVEYLNSEKFIKSFNSYSESFESIPKSKFIS